MPDYLMGVDVGSYESKGTLTDLAGRVVAQHVCKHSLAFVRPGLVEHDAEKIWWDEFCLISKALIDKAGIDASHVSAVGISGVFSMVPIDKEGDPTRPGGILYAIDIRSIAEIAETNARFGEDAIFEVAGNSLSTQSMGPKILWLKRNEPEAYGRAAYFLPAAAFIVGRLTGSFVMSHFDAAFYAPLYDLQGRCWSERFCQGTIDIERLPALRWSEDVAGRVTQRGAAASGLVVGTPVAVGTSDVAAEAVSIGVCEPGQMMMMYGSTAWMTLIVETPLKSRMLWSSPFLFRDTFCLHAGMSTSGSLTRWIRDIAARDILGSSAESGDEAYATLSREAAQVPPGSDGLVVLPYFSGAATPLHDAAARGVMFGLKITHTRGHLYRAAMEGIGYSIAHSLDVMRLAGAGAKEMIAVGGGVKSPVWLQSVSDITGLPQRVPSIAFGASYGDAFLAGLAAGFINARTRIRDWVSVVQTVDPKTEHRQLYERNYDIYRDLYMRNKDLMHRLREQ